MRNLLRAIRQTSGVTVDPNLKLELKFNQTAYNEVGATTLAGVSPLNPAVAAWRSNVNGINVLLTQATSGAQPTVQSDGLYFDGGDWVSMAKISSFDFGNSPFTVEWWQCPAASADYSTLVYNGTRPNGSFNWFVIYNGGFFFYYNNGSVRSVSLTAGFNANVWKHYAAVGDGTNVKTYENGTNIASLAQGTIIANPGTDFHVGAGHINPFNGKITDVRVWGIAKYTTNFTPPTRTT